jgi:hypothetical protein
VERVVDSCSASVLFVLVFLRYMLGRRIGHVSNDLLEIVDDRLWWFRCEKAGRDRFDRAVITWLRTARVDPGCEVRPRRRRRDRSLAAGVEHHDDGGFDPLVVDERARECDPGARWRRGRALDDGHHGRGWWWARLRRTR